MGALSGSLIGVSLMLRRGSRDLQMMLPFGIFLGIGSLVSLLFGTRIIEWYTSQFY
jgi:prepilin signal peptidase PulO-like enzyme (type II secretory pathway)